jgi:hypothetical protein
LLGALSVVIAALWELIQSQVNYGVEGKHLLWGLVFLKVYAKNEETHCAIVDFLLSKSSERRHGILCI